MKHTTLHHEEQPVNIVRKNVTVYFENDNYYQWVTFIIIIVVRC
jgi:hypothetical protein